MSKSGGYLKRYSKEVTDEDVQTFPVIKEIPSRVQVRHRYRSFVWAIGIVVVAILLASGVLFTPTTKKISSNSFTNGNTLNLKQNSTVQFPFDNQNHHLTVDSVYQNSVEVTVRSEPIKLNLTVDETKEVDINGDGTMDMTVKLIKIENGKATIAMRKIIPNRCVENWTCGNWSSCDNGKQQRECTDLNSCGNDFGMPQRNRVCVVKQSMGENASGNLTRLENKTQLMQNETKNLSIQNKTESVIQNITKEQNITKINETPTTNITQKLNETNITIINKTQDMNITNYTGVHQNTTEINITKGIK